MVIGITGGSGAGKSTVSKYLEKKGWFVIDADEIAHRLMVPGSNVLEQISLRFGKQFLNQDGSLNRKKLGNVVFSNPKALADLNQITHHVIIQEINRMSAGKSNVVIDAAILLETGLKDLCEHTIFISCPEQIRIERIMQREGIGEEYARKRISAQKNEDYFRQRCDFEIVNDGIKDIAQQLERCSFL